MSHIILDFSISGSRTDRAGHVISDMWLRFLLDVCLGSLLTENGAYGGKTALA